MRHSTSILLTIDIYQGKDQFRGLLVSGAHRLHLAKRWYREGMARLLRPFRAFGKKRRRWLVSIFCLSRFRINIALFLGVDDRVSPTQGGVDLDMAQ